jgi:hypothetical protein
MPWAIAIRKGNELPMIQFTIHITIVVVYAYTNVDANVEAQKKGEEQPAEPTLRRRVKG